MHKKLFAKYQSKYKSALENESVNTLNQIINEIVERCRDNAEYKKEIGKQYLNIKNTKGNTALTIAKKQDCTEILEKWRNFTQGVSLEESKIEEIYKKSNCSDIAQDKDDGMGEPHEKLFFVTEYSHALESKDVNKLAQIIDKLKKKCKSANVDSKKEIGKQCLEIFNLTNTQGETAVMIAAGQGNTKILKKWYNIPNYFVRDVLFGQDELQEYYKQSNYSYTTQDKKGRNALMLACKSKNPDCIEYILSPETKETLNQKDISNRTPIEYAMKYDVYKKHYNTVGEFVRVFTCVIDKKSKYFPNECFHLDKNYEEAASKMADEGIRDDILKAYKKTNSSNTKKVTQKKDISKIINDKTSGYNNFDEVSNNKVFKKRPMDFSNELEKSSHKRLKTNDTIATNTSKLLETHDSIHDIDIDIDIDAANNLQKNAYKPESSKYHKCTLDKFSSFINKLNNSSKDYTAQTVLLSECKELFCLPNNNHSEEELQFLSRVDDDNIRIKLIDIILGSSNECN